MQNMVICILETMQTIFFSIRQLNRQLESESATGAKNGYEHSRNNDNILFFESAFHLGQGLKISLIFTYLAFFFKS